VKIANKFAGKTLDCAVFILKILIELSANVSINVTVTAAVYAIYLITI